MMVRRWATAAASLVSRAASMILRDDNREIDQHAFTPGHERPRVSERVDPTPEEIRKLTAEIRAGWTDKDWIDRRVGQRTPFKGVTMTEFEQAS